MLIPADAAALTAGLEVVPSTTQGEPTWGEPRNAIRHDNETRNGGMLPESQLQTQRDKLGVWRFNPRERWLVAAVVMLLIVVIVIGSVLGTRRHTNGAHTPPVPTASTESSAPPTPTLRPIRERSKLAVTGYKNGQTFKINLFSQGDDDYIRLSTFDSYGNKWGSPRKLLKAKAGTPLAASSWNRSTSTSVCLTAHG
jgi:hypothetical protein